MNTFELYQDQNYGAVLRIHNNNIADEFDDFLTEECFVFYNFKDEGDVMEFFFGQASSVEKIQELIDLYNENKR